jgi:hypothetical protein
MNSEEREAQAKQRFMLQGMEFVGYIFVVLGAAEFFLMPVILKKAWNKQDGKPS